jgi:phenylalanyl-tRNA synthetase beta chain
LAELSVEALMNAVQPELEYKPLPKFPAITRDIALVCDINLPVSRLEKCIRSCSTGILEDIVLFDVYTGAQVEKDKKSVAFSLTLRSPDHTLRDDEADAFINKALLALKDSYGALLRE